MQPTVVAPRGDVQSHAVEDLTDGVQLSKLEAPLWQPDSVGRTADVDTAPAVFVRATQDATAPVMVLSRYRPTLASMEMDMDKWAAESAEKIAEAVKANPNTFQIPEGVTEDEATTAYESMPKTSASRSPTTKLRANSSAMPAEKRAPSINCVYVGGVVACTDGGVIVQLREQQLTQPLRPVGGVRR